MSFLSISYNNFRNLKDATLNIGYPEVFLVGKNGQGKTNFLEALYVSSYGLSFKSLSEAKIATNNSTFYNVRALYKTSEQVSHNIFISYNKGKKEIQKDIKKINRQELINTVPCILFYTSDIDFVSGSQARKRFFFDQCLSMYDRNYLFLLQNYYKVLASKNAVLRSQNNFELLDVYNAQVCNLALSILKKRVALIDEFNSEFGYFYKGISGLSDVKIKYQSTINVKGEKELLQVLNEKKENEISMKSSFIGPHRDKVTYIKNGTSCEKELSNGQRRLVSLVLRILQAKFYTEKLKRKPILLMDDIMLELDSEKRQKFMSFLPSYEQLFSTFVQGELCDAYRKKDTKIFYVENGTLSERN